LLKAIKIIKKLIDLHGGTAIKNTTKQGFGVLRAFRKAVKWFFLPQLGEKYENETMDSWVYDGGGCVRLFDGLGEGR
jgi:hypothetical protein